MRGVAVRCICGASAGTACGRGADEPDERDDPAWRQRSAALWAVEVYRGRFSGGRLRPASMGGAWIRRFEMGDAGPYPQGWVDRSDLGSLRVCCGLDEPGTSGVLGICVVPDSREGGEQAGGETGAGGAGERG